MGIAIDLHRNCFPDADFAHRFGFTAKPTTFLHKGNQHLPFENPYLIVIVEEFLPGYISLQQVQLTTRLFFFFLGNVGLEPEISIRSDRDRIVTMLDAEKSVLAKHFRYIAPFIFA